jgi:nitrous oxidase accessory protein NosD
MLRTLSFIGFCALLAVPSAAGANPGALEINQDCIALGCFAGDAAGLPIDITQPGSYILTSDISVAGTSAFAAVSVTAAQVDIDLNGHTLDGAGTCTGSPVTTCSGFAGTNRGINVNASAPSITHIHNGTIRGFGQAGIIIFSADDGTLLEHLTVTQNANGIFVQGDTSATTTRISATQLVRNQSAGAGITNGSSQLIVENSTIAGNGGDGIDAGSGSVIAGNRFSNNASGALYCNPGTCALGQNAFVGNNGGATQFNVGTLSNMGGNVCLDHAASACP